MWLNQKKITELTKRVSAHSSFDAEIQAIELALIELTNHNYPRVTLLVDNESAARAIWNTSFHNLQSTSINAMINFRKWITKMNISQVIFNVSWCSAHMDVIENEYVDSIVTELFMEDRVSFSTLHSKIAEVKQKEFEIWDSATRKHNALGHEYLRLKYKGKRIGPTLGSRKNAFIIASKDNIKILSRLTRIVTNHAPTGEYRQRFFPTEPTTCQYDNDFQTRSHTNEMFKLQEQISYDGQTLQNEIRP
ncbi:hypothetical protein AX15_004308 [Amanita polypyramis BW_CC]|nr:hypothetical protein AX15_004308 [Amanita polypyramis BW_CC]